MRVEIVAAATCAAITIVVARRATCCPPFCTATLSTTADSRGASCVQAAYAAVAVKTGIAICPGGLRCVSRLRMAGVLTRARCVRGAHPGLSGTIDNTLFLRYGLCLRCASVNAAATAARSARFNFCPPPGDAGTAASVDSGPLLRVYIGVGCCGAGGLEGERHGGQGAFASHNPPCAGWRGGGTGGVWVGVPDLVTCSVRVKVLQRSGAWPIVVDDPIVCNRPGRNIAIWIPPTIRILIEEQVPRRMPCSICLHVVPFAVCSIPLVGPNTVQVTCSIAPVPAHQQVCWLPLLLGSYGAFFGGHNRLNLRGTCLAVLH